MRYGSSTTHPDARAVFGVVWGLCWFCVLGTAAAQDAGPAILAPDARVERLFHEGSFTEGPAMGRDGCVYFSDLTFDPDTTGADGHIWRYDPATGKCTVFRSPSGMSNGIEFDARGRMIIAQGSDFGGRGIIAIDPASRKGGVLVSHFKGQSLNSPNDLVIDGKGRVYFTDPRYGDRTSVKQPVMGVYRLDRNGALTLITKRIPMPNGIALSPDQKTLYVACNDEGAEDGSRPPEGNISSFDILPDGSVQFHAVLIRFANTRLPDGMAVDARGNLYVAIRDEAKPGVAVITPAGAEIAWIPVPEVPSNVGFGRPPRDSTLFITAGRSLYRIETLQKGSFAARWD
jgi:gluconolactonase